MTNPMRAHQTVSIKKKSILAVIFIIFIIIAIIATLLSIAIVGPGERGVLLTFGKVSDTVLGEGFHWKMPIAQSVHNMDVKIQRYSKAEKSASRDLQDVNTEVTLNYHIDPLKANKIFQTLSPQYEQRIIVPAVSEAVKAVTAKFDAEELITRRSQVRSDIEAEIKDKLTKFDIIVDQVSITDFEFSIQFANAIESKQVAEQDALKAENILKRVEVEKEQAITKAEGEAGARLAVAKAEAEAIAIQGQALRANPEVLDLRQIEKWDGVLPRVLISDEGVPLILDIGTSAPTSTP